MLRIYLDQKDFSGLARGRAEGDRDSAATLDYLADLVSREKIRTYFSWVHIVETLRYRDDRLSIVAEYCDVVDTLTQGHCVRLPPEVITSEIAIAMAKAFGESIPDTASYPYGTYTDAMGGVTPEVDIAELVSDETLDNLFASTIAPESLRSWLGMVTDEQLNARMPGLSIEPERLRTIMLALCGRTREERREGLRMVFAYEPLAGALLDGLSDNLMLEFNRLFPSAGFVWTKESTKQALLGSPEARRNVWSAFFAGVAHFKELITHYSQAHKDFRAMGSLFDDSGAQLTRQLERMQMFEPVRTAILGTSPRWDRDIASSVGNRIVDDQASELQMLAIKHGVTLERAVAALKRDGFKALPFVASLTTILRSFLAHHKGEPSRVPADSDLRDLYHGLYAPYVDYFVTDRFSAEVLRPLSRMFPVKILRSVSELRTELEGRV